MSSLENQLAAGSAQTAEDRKQRKRVQNRLNQRARRQRLKTIAANATPSRRPFRVDRWRLGDDAQPYQAITASLEELGTPPSQPTDLVVSSQEPREQSPDIEVITLDETDRDAFSAKLDSSKAFATTLYADLLLHLIEHNVFRAFVSNANLLDVTTAIASPRNLPKDGWLAPPVVYQGDMRCTITSTIHQINPNMPKSLHPTPAQATDTHSFWINVIPFARVRDNLIRWEACFDHNEFLRDLLGSVIRAAAAKRRREGGILSSSSCPLVIEDSADDPSVGRNGFVVWGEAHDKRNWEATPGFLKKWSWAVEGCDEIVEISNNWRIIRGEEPIALSSGPACTS
ncbi:hypothetical protein CGCF415_v008671 [Colletotrichum fructicola]|nr:hypothetical protein CGCF415_v008671 [Colletotrichum fructicola]KAF4931636.1 hypothetical protein CGCF245_v011119 [Colletotrichum fructicola]